MLDSHPSLAVPLGAHAVLLSAVAAPGQPFQWRTYLDDLFPQPGLTSWRTHRVGVERSMETDPPTNLSEGARRVLAVVAQERGGKPSYGAVLASHPRELGEVAAAFPEARVVHLLRDGRDLAASVMELGWADGIERAALEWRERVRTVRRAGKRLGVGRYHEVRYEDLVVTPEVTLRLLCADLELPFARTMLDHRASAARAAKAGGRPHENRFVTHRLMPALRDWRRDLPRNAIERFEALAGDLLSELGYELRSPRHRLRRPWLATRRDWLGWHREHFRGRNRNRN
jgi:hypothetical protein